MKIPAAFHLHSDWSYDGKFSLETLRAKFSNRGYRVMMMTEHDLGFSAQRLEEHRKICAAVSSEKTLVISGIEYSDSTNTIHVLVWGNVPFLGEGLPTERLLKEVKSAGGIAVLAHPSRKDAWKRFDPTWTDGLLGVEIWNRKTDGWHPSATALPIIEKSGMAAFVGMDFHTDRQMFPLSMELDITGEINEAAVLDCLKTRRCSPRAFGLAMDNGLFGGISPLLNVAERARRFAAHSYKQFKKSRAATASKP